MRFDIITIFPKAFDSYFGESMIKRARAKGLLDIRVHNLRDFAVYKKTAPATMPARNAFSIADAGGRIFGRVDEKPFGGGPGMVIKIEPLVRAFSSLKLNTRRSSQDTLVVLFTPGGKQFDAKAATGFAKKYNRIVMICGHYEGIDERIVKVVENCKLKIAKLSVGPYVLTGGELPAMLVVDAVARHIPGVLGKAESLEESRHGIGVQVYTRPEAFAYKGKKYRVPKVLLSGNHKKIEEWREKQKLR